MTRILRWERYRYGKRVEYDGGPILPGFEHRCTGRSSGFPDELASHCHPSKIGLCDGSFADWDRFPWQAEGGGLVVVPHSVGSDSWVVAGRLRRRSEAGEAVPGRLYSETQYVAIPAERYDYSVLRTIGTQLSANPPADLISDLDVLKIPLAEDDVPLPEDWLESIKVYICGLMSGVVVSCQDWATSVAAFLAEAFWVLAAVPTTLAWRIPVGAGVVLMDGTYALACGMAAKAGLRVIGGRPTNEADLNLAAGIEYWEWLAESCGYCRTAGQLRSVVDSELGLEGAFAIDSGLPWREAAAHAVGRLERSKRVRRVLSDLEAGKPLTTELPEEDMDLNLLGELCARFSRANSGDVARLIGLSCCQWPSSVWKRFLEKDAAGDAPLRRAVSRLFGNLQIDGPADVMIADWVELPMDLATSVADRLRQATEQTPDDLEWLTLAEAGDQAWIRLWRQKVNARLVWLAYASGRQAFAGTLQSFLDREPLWEAICAIPTQVPPPEQVALLARSATSRQRSLLVRLALGALRHSVWLTLYLLDLSSPRRPSEVLAGSLAKRYESFDLASHLATELLEHHLPVTRSMLNLLGAGIAGTAELKSDLRKTLSDQMGEPFATALLGGAPTDSLGLEPCRSEARLLCEDCIQSSHLIAERLLERLPTLPPDPLREANRLLHMWQREPPDGHPSSLTARAVLFLSGRGEEPSLDECDSGHLEQVLALLEIRCQEPIPRRIQSHVMLELAIQCWHEAEPPVLDDIQFYTILNAIACNDTNRERWRTRIDERGWAKETGWRLILGPARHITYSESEIIRRLTPVQLIDRMLDDVCIPRDMVAEIAKQNLEQYFDAIRPLDRAIPLLSKIIQVVDHGDQRFIRMLLEYVFARACLERIDIRSAASSRSLLERVLFRDESETYGSVELRRYVKEVANLLGTNPRKLVKEYLNELRKGQKERRSLGCG